MSTGVMVQFRLPDLGEGVVETEIVRWLVSPGDALAEDQPMVEVMTDKATVEIPAPATGTVVAITAPEGAVVEVGTVIVEIEAAAGTVAHSNRPVNAPGAPASESPGAASAPGVSAAAGSAPGSTTSRRIQATPLVRKLAAQLGVELEVVSGTGPNGRITEDDVRAAASTSPQSAQGNVSASLHVPPGGLAEPVRGMRRQIASHLAMAQRVPAVTVVEECDLTELDAARRSAGRSWIPYVVQAVLRGFAQVPEFNAVFDDASETMWRYDTASIGIAVQSPAGLMVPVLHRCEDLGLAQIDEAVAALAEGARAGTLSPEQLRGSTFTVTSAGKFGGLFTTPLLNVPEVGILGLHRIAERPAVVGGAVVPRLTANVSVSFDHRALDGVTASRFLLAVIEALQDPTVFRP
jgi:pyruvate/2-oxoglutarate dehydrogenase complex dihydrolipoamide acyltransferase (E2) component